MSPSAKRGLKEFADTIKRNLIHLIIQVNMRRTGNNNDFLRIVQFGIPAQLFYEEMCMYDQLGRPEIDSIS